MAEQLRLDQILRYCAAVDRDEPFLPSRARVVDGPRHQLLAGAGLSLDQNRHRVRRDPPGEQNDAPHLRAAMDDLVEGGRLLRRQPGAQTFQLPVRLPQQIGEKVSRDVEGDGDLAHTVILRRLDDRCLEARLGQDDPHRGHGRRAGAQMERKRGVRAAGRARPFAGADRGWVDLAEGRGAGEPLVQQVETDPARAPFEPIEVTSRLVAIRGEQEGRIERTVLHGLGHRPDTVRVFLRRFQVRMADPTDQDATHRRPPFPIPQPIRPPQPL